MDVGMELRPQRRRSLGRPNGSVWRHVVRVMVLRRRRPALFPHRHIPLPCLRGNTRGNRSLQPHTRHPAIVRTAPIEKWRGEYSDTYSAKAEEVLSTKEIFRTVLSNRFLWYIAFANAFVYMVRYGCLDWAPTILTEKGINIKEAGWAYFAYEIAAIPGTIICGWLSDHVFKGRRAIPTMLFMAVVAVFIFIYWQNLDNINVVIACLIGIGFFIYGPVMLIGVQALDLSPKNAAGTAAGLTGFMGYVLGTALLANVVIGFVSEHAGWGWTFILLMAACAMAIVFMLLTYSKEQYLVKNKE